MKMVFIHEKKLVPNFLHLGFQEPRKTRKVKILWKEKYFNDTVHETGHRMRLPKRVYCRKFEFYMLLKINI